MNELIVAEKLNPIEIFQNNGMEPILKEIETKALSVVADVETESGRKDIASIAHRVARSKTLIDGIGKDMVSEWKAKSKKVDAVRKHARDFLDGLKDQVREPLTEWEAAEAIRQEEEDRKEKEKIQTRVDDLLKFDVVLPFTDVAVMSDDMYLATLASAQETYNAEQKRLADEEADRKAEADRLADENRKLEIKKKRQSLHEVYVTPEMTSVDIETLIENYKIEMLPGTEFQEFQKEATEGYEKAVTTLCKIHGERVQQEETATKQKAAQDKIDEDNRKAIERQDKLDADKAAIKKQKDQNRIDGLLNTGLRFNGSEFFYEDILTVHHVEIMAMPDEGFRSLVVKVEEKIRVRKDRKAKQDRKDQEDFERKANEKAEKDAEEKSAREKLEEEKRVEAEKAEKARAEALKPDKEKLEAWSNHLLDMVIPPLTDDKAIALATAAVLQVYGAAHELNDKIKGL